MSSIDDIFKKPSHPSNIKRKLEPARDPTEIYKAAKLDANGDTIRGKEPTVEDAEDDDVAGPELPPDFEEDIPDDEEGRFFGGGVTKDTTNALDYIDKHENEGAASLIVHLYSYMDETSNGLARFMASEADLDVEIKTLSILSEHPKLYNEFAELGCAGSLVSLLTHENTDISIDAIEILGELIDEDVEAEEDQWDAIANSMLDADILELLSQNLARLNEENEVDRAGIYHILNILESLSSRASIADRIGQESGIMPWLHERISRKEKRVSQNKQYSAEILAILLQSSSKNRLRFISLEGVDTLLQLLSVYRKLDPQKDSDEEEYFENLFDCLTCVVDEDEGKDKFIEAEGIELAQIMLREGTLSKPRALRVLNHALGGRGGLRACEKFVEAGLLRTAFGMFMKKQDKSLTEHLLGIFSSLLRLLPGDTSGRIRTLAKFVEKDYEKVTRLIKLRREYKSKLSVVEQDINQEKSSLSQDDLDALEGEWLSRRLDAGLFSLQTIDVILAWLVAEDDGAKAKIKSLMADQDEDLGVIRGTLQG
ncbi:uncharacterized protein ARB_06115 [Trichophyton benhamiae CBS 112371]|uniref:Beta-catenin-like protein 1 N-terminal domain-containing protein n=1 Tax=Arthroderma benhamiae (strain ATCC MYA-4681 / CBS 112371) TaxID=663331 RepID=D4APE7_ARTBC|nr:uncharacterized protein ARB_06115 [Trichophyton benhamiae CBS 112371]EFE35158.1 hypothetical protein ARB_06115 [Trichophyton benhamiae CBS 112371]